MNIILVHNPLSGSAPALDEIRSKCQSHNIVIDHTINITSGFPESLLPHLTPGTLIAAIGGDGTLNSVVQHVHGTGSIFVPLPGGTFNHFTKDAGIPQDLDDALANLATATPRQIDVASVNGRLFLNNSSIGIYPSSLRVRELAEPTFGKWPSAIIGTIRALVKFKLYTVTMEGDTFRTPFVFIGNNDYHLETGGQRDSLTGGTLCAYAIRSSRRSSLFMLLLFALTRNLDTADEFIIHKDTAITIETMRRLVSVSADGEVLRLASPLHYKLLPRSLTILG